MEFFERFMNWFIAPCLTFGPLFLVAAGKTPKAERFLRILGVIMVSAALISLWWTMERQRSEVSLLQQRLQYLEERVQGGATEAALSDSRP